MSILNKNSTTQTRHYGWYGECSTDNDFDLTDLSADDVQLVFQMNPSNTTIRYFDPNDVVASDFQSLEKGKNYGVVLKSGEGDVNIPGFISTNIGTAGSLSLTDTCEPPSGNYEIYDPSSYLPGQAEEDWHKEIYLRTTDGTPLGNGPFPFKITGIHINSNDFDGWKNDSLQQTYTQFNESLDNGYFEGSTTDESYIELGIKADEESEGDETFRISLIGYPDVYLDVTIDDTSRDPEITLSSQGKQFATEPNTTPKVIQGYDILVDCNFMSLDGDFTWEISSTDGVTVDDIDKVVLPYKGNNNSDLEFNDTLTGTWTQGTDTYAGIRICPTLHSTSDTPNPKTITLKVTNISTGIDNSIDIEVYENPPVYAEMTASPPDGLLDADQTLTFDLSFNISGGNLLSSGDEGQILGTVFNVPFKITGDFGIYYPNSSLASNELVIEKYVVDPNTSEFVWRDYTDYAGSGYFTPNENGEVILTLPAVGGSLPPAGAGTSDYFESINDVVTASFRISFKSPSTLSESDLAGKTLNVELVNSGELTTGPTSHTYSFDSVMETYELTNVANYGEDITIDPLYNVPVLNETPNGFDHVVIQLKTSNVPEGTIVPWRIQMTPYPTEQTVTLEDFVGLTSNEGTFTVGSHGSDSEGFLYSELELEIAKDLTTENLYTELFTFELYDENNPLLDSSNFSRPSLSFLIADTSKTP